MLHKIKYNKFKRAVQGIKLKCSLPVFSFGVGQVIGKTQRPNAHSFNFVGQPEIKNQTVDADSLLAGHYKNKIQKNLARLLFGLAINGLKTILRVPNLNFPAIIVLKPTEPVPDTFYLGHSGFRNQKRHAQVI